MKPSPPKPSAIIAHDGGSGTAATEKAFPSIELSANPALPAKELCGKVGDGVNQAADLISATASIPSLNFIPLTTFGNWF
jgi:hypothetical protein